MSKTDRPPAPAHVSRGPGMATTRSRLACPFPPCLRAGARPDSAAGSRALLAHQTLGALYCGGLWRSAPGRTVGGSRRTGRRVEQSFRHGLSKFIHALPSASDWVEGRQLSARVRGRSRRQPRPLASGSPRGLPGPPGPGTPKIRAPVPHLGPSVEHGIAEALGDFQVAGCRPVSDSVPALLHPLFPSLFRKQDDSGQSPRSDH